MSFFYLWRSVLWRYTQVVFQICPTIKEPGSPNNGSWAIHLIFTMVPYGLLIFSSSEYVFAQQQCTPNDNQIAVYRHGNYQGSCQIQTLGEFANAGSIGLANDSISSVRVGRTVKAVLCRHNNFVGTCETFEEDDSLLTNNVIGNDAVSSLKVLLRNEGDMATCTPSSNQVALFRHINYQGACVLLDKGAYSNSQQIGLENDSVSSIKVGNKSQGILNQHNDHLGKSEPFFNDDPDLRNNRIGNDQVSSVTIKKLLVKIEVNQTRTVEDDYFGWTPIPVRIKRVSPTWFTSSVTIRGVGNTKGGALRFQKWGDGKPPTKENFKPQKRITIKLPKGDKWVNFWVAGFRPSRGEKDVSIIVERQFWLRKNLGRMPVMVRVRKNAESLTVNERDRFLLALAKVHGLENGALSDTEEFYEKYSPIHSEAFNLGIHQSWDGFPLFLAWHRAFLLNLERELQSFDKSVALPYWQFDEATTRLFAPEFLGTTQGGGAAVGGFLVRFSEDNPLRGWQMRDGNGALVRRNNGNNAPIPNNRLEGIFNDPDNKVYQEVSGDFELMYHNGAHSAIGGWLTSGGSPRDPLFFLLHANVDRVWAHWQAHLKKFDPTGQDTTVYSATGSHPGPNSPFLKGSYAHDHMWPWSGINGTDQGEDWPEFSYAMPPGAKGTGPNLPPTPVSMVDYLDVNGLGKAHGSSYDDIDYFGEAIN